jgi:hypothetical protein
MTTSESVTARAGAAEVASAEVVPAEVVPAEVVPAEVVPAEVARPRSAAGAFLKATAANRRAARDVRPDYAARVFFYCAFELVVWRRFRRDSPVAEITRSVAIAGRRHAPVVVPALEAEMLIRDALGEAVPIEGIPLDAIITTHLLVFASLVDELALNDDEVDALIVEAEKRADRLGHPPEVL